MKVYEELRGELNLSLAAYMDEYDHRKEPIPEERMHDITLIKFYITDCDDSNDAYDLRQLTKDHVKRLCGWFTRTFFPGSSEAQFQRVIFAVVNKSCYKKVTLLRTMYQEQKMAVVRAELDLELALDHHAKKMKKQEDSLKEQLKDARSEIERLKLEIRFLTNVVIDYREKLERLQKKYNDLLKEKAGVNTDQYSLDQPVNMSGNGPTMWGQYGRSYPRTVVEDDRSYDQTYNGY